MIPLNTDILLVGGGGHCISVLDCLLDDHRFSRIGIVDTTERLLFGASYLGTDEDLPRLFEEGWHYAVVALGSVGDSSKRVAIYKYLKEIGFDLPTIIDPTAIVSRHAVIGEGVFVGKKAVVNAEASVGNCAILNTGCILEHNVSVGDFVHVSPGAVLCGAVCVGEKSHVGANSVVLQGICIGESTTVGAGSVVLRNIASNVVAYGNPCREVKRK